MTLFDTGQCRARSLATPRLLCGKATAHGGPHGEWVPDPRWDSPVQDVHLPEPRDGVVRPAPVVRNDDPWTAHVAAERVEPKRETRRWLVLMRLREAGGGWVPGSEFVRPQVGGSEGLRRLRELRNPGGWPIERRPALGPDTAWEYQLQEAPMADA